MAFDVNNFVVDHVLRGVMTSSHDGTVLWSVNQITDPTLTISTESSTAVDALGSTIATFYRGKNAEFSATNSLFDLGLYAAQNGTEKQVAAQNAPIVATAFETLTVPSDGFAVQLAHTPRETPAEIYLLKGDGTLSDVLTYSAAAGAGKFTYDSATATITLPSTATAGSEYFIQYEYDATSAVAVTGNAVDFPVAGKFVMEVLGTDVCDQTTLIHAYIIFPNAKLSPDVEVSFTTDGNHPFTIVANQAYCDSQKTLFQIIIPEEE